MIPDFSVPRRQHPVGMAILAVKFSWRTLSTFWPIFIGLSLAEIGWRHYAAIALVFIGVVASAIVYYLRFRYHVASDALIVERGLIQRERLQIPFDRIQAVQLFQGPIQQLAGLTGLRVDTAGSSGSELELLAVHRSEAEGLQEHLRRRMENVEPPEETNGEETGAVGTSGHQRDEGEPLVALDFPNLMKVGLSQNHLKSAFISLAVVMSFFQGLEDRMVVWLNGLPAMVQAVLGLATVFLILPGIMLFLLLGVLTSVALAVLRYWRLKSRLDGEGLKLEMGLFRRNAFEVPFKKIHLTEWNSNWIRRQLGFETLRIRQAQAQSGSGGLRVFIPAVEPVHRAAMEAALYPDLESHRGIEFRPAGRLRWLLWLVALLPAGAVLFVPATENLALAAVWTGFVYWTTGRRFASLRMSVHRDAIVLERGWFWKTRVLLKMSQLQGVEWKRNALLERRGIGHLVFHTAAGARSFRYMRREDGVGIRDAALHRLHSLHPGPGIVQ